MQHLDDVDRLLVGFPKWLEVVVYIALAAGETFFFVFCYDVDWKWDGSGNSRLLHLLLVLVYDSSTADALIGDLLELHRRRMKDSAIQATALSAFEIFMMFIGRLFTLLLNTSKGFNPTSKY
jgi:hypothetical protein